MERKTELTVRSDTSPLGRRITKRMAGMDKNDRDFADEIGIGYHTLRKARRLQDPRPTQETLERIAAGLGTTAHWLLYGTDGREDGATGHEEVPSLAGGGEPVAKTIADVMADARKQIAEIACVKLNAVRLELKIEY